jgi:hypothetical protein
VIWSLRVIGMRKRVSDMPFIKSVEGRSEVQVRACLASAFAIAIIVGFFLDKVPAESFMGLAVMAITYYFAKRGDEDKPTS